MSEAETLVRQGIQAIRAKDRAEGKRLLTQALRLDPQNDEAWVWLARAVPEPEKQLQCVERALKINPDNEDALALQQKLSGNSTPARTAQTPARTAPPAAAPAAPKSGSRELGRAMGRFDANPGAIFLNLAGTSLITIVAALYLLVTLGNGIPRTFTPTVMGMAIAGFVALVGAFIIIRQILNLMRRIIIYEGGMEVSVFGIKRTWYWDDFSAFKSRELIKKYRAGGTYPSYEYTLYANGHQVMHINRVINNHKRLGDILKEKTTQAILRQLITVYNRGEPVKFERGIVVSQEGFKYQNRLYAWKDVREFLIKNGDLYIHRHENPHFGIRVWTFAMPNALALFSLISTIRGRR